jgi:serine/threonine protein kinase
MNPVPAIAPAPHADPRGLSPTAICDVIFGAALAAGADAVWIEPQAEPPHAYVLTVEQHGRTVATATLDGRLGAATIARLAFIAQIDLVSRTVGSAAVVVRGPEVTADVVVTIRPGRALRAELYVRRHGERRAVAGRPIALKVGDVVDHYRIAETLGAGGMGRVYRAEHTALARAFALKVMHGAPPGDTEAVGRFVREARAAARIHHPNIVDVFDFGYLGDGRPYLVMELLAGSNLSGLLGDPLPPAFVWSVARQVASGLAAAHDAGVIHADVSPSNIFVDAEGRAKLVDFGLAQMRNETVALTEDKPADHVYGTPSYIAPEQIRGLSAQEASDQYALGAVIFEMLVGTPPFVARSIRELCISHLRSPVPELETPHGPLPAKATALVNRCLAKRPEDRFARMDDVVAAIADLERSQRVEGWQQWMAP